MRWSEVLFQKECGGLCEVAGVGVGENEVEPVLRESLLMTARPTVGRAQRGAGRGEGVKTWAWLSCVMSVCLRGEGEARMAGTETPVP